MSLFLQAEVPERGLDITLEVADGETLALVGPNGAGKSTILSLIAGTLRPRTGRITLDDRVLTADDTWVAPHARQVTTLTQDPVLFPHLTVLGNIMFGLRAQGMPGRQAKAEATRWLDEIGLAELAGRRPSQLSGGQAQRVAIARALAAQPRLLLLDEPMAALDVDVAPALREQLRRFLTERTSIVVTHDVLDAMTLASRVAVVQEGRLVEQGPTMDVLTRPHSAFAARFAGLNLVSARLLGRGAASEFAAFRPSVVQLVARGGDAVLERTVRVLEPRGDLVRVRTEDISADLTPQEVAQRHLQPGLRIHLSIPADAVAVYPGPPAE